MEHNMFRELNLLNVVEKKSPKSIVANVLVIKKRNVVMTI